MTITGKTVLITGANRGIGQALVEEALSRGAKRIYALASTKQEMGVKFWESLPYEKSKDVPYVRTFADPD